MCLTQQTLKPLLLNVHASRVQDLETPDVMRTDPQIPVAHYHDGFGNLCSRIVSAGKRFSDLDTTKGEWFPLFVSFCASGTRFAMVQG